MQPIGWGGQPARDAFRAVRPPVAVLVDLTVLFPAAHTVTGGTTRTACSCTRWSRAD